MDTKQRPLGSLRVDICARELLVNLEPQPNSAQNCLKTNSYNDPCYQQQLIFSYTSLLATAVSMT